MKASTWWRDVAPATPIIPHLKQAGSRAASCIPSQPHLPLKNDRKRDAGGERRHCLHRHYSAACRGTSDQPCYLCLCDACCDHHSRERDALGLGGSAFKDEGMGLPLSLVKTRSRLSSSPYIDSSSGKSSTSDSLCVCISPFLSSKEWSDPTLQAVSYSSYSVKWLSFGSVSVERKLQVLVTWKPSFSTSAWSSLYTKISLFTLSNYSLLRMMKKKSMGTHQSTERAWAAYKIPRPHWKYLQHNKYLICAT